MARSLLSSAVVKCVILDLDGTLVDSNDVHADSWVDALRAHGYDVPFGRVRPLVGMTSDRLLAALAPVSADSSKGESILATRREIFLRDYLRAVKPFPEVRELLLRMRDEGLSLMVASSPDEELLETLLGVSGASDLIRSRTPNPSSGAISAPDSITAALDALSLEPGEAAMLGDTPYDLEAANSARVDFVGLRSGGWGEPSLAGAIAVYDDPADLLERFDTSPFSSHR